MRKIIFFGKLPPPIGGVTIKNQVLLNFLRKNYETTHFRSNIFYDTLKLIVLFTRNNTIILSINSKKAIFFIKILYIIKRAHLKNVLLFVTGGTIFIQEIKRFKNKAPYRHLKNIVVEAESMKKELEIMGFDNISHVSNFREDNLIKKEISSSPRKKFIFLSRVDPSKGINVCIEAFNQIGEDYQLDIFGPISESYKSLFYRSIKSSKNIDYKGIVEYETNKIYELLSQYDCLLFPSKWHNEGIPGVLIESKFAGITVICSDINFNKEIIKNNKHGIVLSSTLVENIVNSIYQIYENGNLIRFKESNYKDRLHYSINHLSKKITNLIENS